MNCARDIIDLWPSVSDLARDIGLKRPGHGSLMKMRNSIPVAYWPKLVEAAQRRQIDGVTLDALVAAHSPSLTRLRPND